MNIVKLILVHNRDEGKERISMTLEWNRRDALSVPRHAR